MRRSMGYIVLLVSMWSAFLVIPATTGTAASPATLTPLPATQSDKVVDAYGVGIHLPFLDTPYADATRVADALSDLGVRHVRDDLYLNNERQYAGIQTVADRGIKFNLIMGRPDKPGTPADYVRTVADLPAGAVESVEGINEWDLFGAARPDWATEVATWQKDLYAETKANPATSHLPVLSPSMAFKWNYAALPDLSPYADKANAHMYPGGFRPSNEITNITNALRTVVPSKPLITTEAGYHNAVNTTNGHLPVNEQTAGVYMPRLLLDHFMRGEERVYSYELIDEFDDSAKTNPEAHFGLLRRDWSPKPAYTAMKTLLGLMADPGPEFTTQPLSLASTGWPSDGKYLVTQKRDGSYVLLLWRDAQVWDPVTRTALPDPTANVTLTFGEQLDMSVYRLSQGAQPVSQSRGTSINVPMDGSVTAITLKDAPVAAPAPAPTAVTATPGDRSATVSWDMPDSGAEVTGFEVVRSGGVAQRVDAMARSFTDTGLVNGTSYTYSVRALGTDGDSAAVSSAPVVPATVPGAPRIASTTAGTGAVTVAWGAPGSNGRPILGYQLSHGSNVKNVSASTRKATLSGLPRRTWLRVAVRARNEMGWSAYAYTPYVRTR
jgi:hypothetical protein